MVAGSKSNQVIGGMMAALLAMSGASYYQNNFQENQDYTNKSVVLSADRKCADETTQASYSVGSENIPGSVDGFVKQHEQAYIDAWGAGGFLPTASIDQTFWETSFSATVPSFAQAHNMGGVKTSGDVKTQYAKTLALFGDDAVSNNGSGTGVGDNTGGSYTHFKSFDAGIVGKAEFLWRNPRYAKAVNNTDGADALKRIAAAGWATDPSYASKLLSNYGMIKRKFGYLDEKAIAKYGEHPTDGKAPTGSTVKTASSSHGSSVIDGYVKWALDNAQGDRVRYVWGANGPDGYDCSHYMAAALKSVPALASYQYASTTGMPSALGKVGFKKVSDWDGKDATKLKKGDILVSATHTEMVSETPSGKGKVKTVGAHTSSVPPADQVSEETHDTAWWADYQAYRLGDGAATASTNSGGDQECGTVVTAGDVTSGDIAKDLKTKGEGDTRTIDYKSMQGYAGYDSTVPNASGYPEHQCTNWAYLRSKSLGYVDKYPGDWAHNGNGENWVTALVGKGFTKSSTPQAGDIVSFPGGVAGNDPVAGHVAVVEKIEADGSLWLSEGGTGWYAHYQGPVLHKYASGLWKKYVSQGMSFAHPGGGKA
ncbi:hypothetical protein A200_07764 [Parascardovia denticolens IPLA 20019]|uniref:CHAP domain-containing protein n=1 Tax=Parascardovia denticolens TaxID=78258 RepID=UPI0002669E44|nr:CHAP domain-containing protein [Parascardovia denticolens]EIT87561.1 hypothetical protein A200_07764 [Parascardovia denticolens IPLA 20019]